MMKYAACICFAVACGAQTAYTQTEQAGEWVPQEGFLLRGVTSFRRGGIENYDALESYMVLHGLDTLEAAAGATVDLGDGQPRTWEPVTFDEQGTVAAGQLGRGGCVVIPVTREHEGIMMLHGTSHGGVYVNGIPHTANVYGYDYYHIPIELREGANSIIARSGRRGLQLRLYEPSAAQFFIADDTTLPDAVVGSELDAWGAVIVINATRHEVGHQRIVCRGPELQETSTRVAPLAPASMRKIGFRIQGDVVNDRDATVALTLELHDADGELQHSLELELQRRRSGEAQRRTFVSEIDGSVQYYGLRRAVPLSPEDPAPALVLSCHGAGVEGIGQAAAYAPKSWLHLVAPTNRRPYGFDWEDMGRADAMEVLEIARRELRHDPARIYLTGHSMGGHGTWHIGSLFPDRFAAIGPSAGWISFATYGRRRAGSDNSLNPLQTLLARGQIVGDPSQFMENLQQQAVYVLHGGDDDNVPADQARRMTELLAEEHHDWYYHEEPGKSHWWSNQFDDGGATCMDWPDMYDAFARHALPPTPSVRSIKFVTANPGVSNACHWLSVEAQQKHHALSRVEIRTWPNKRQFVGTTENVAVLRLDTGHFLSRGPISIELDGQRLEDIPFPEAESQLWLRREADAWQLVERPAVAQKGPHRYGAIKNELRHGFLFVYGTAGEPSENAWMLGKARLDAETLWYRGNGSVDLIADTSFVPEDYPDRTVVLYGNATTNRVWPLLLATSPVQVRNGVVQLDGDEVSGDDLACLFVRPRVDSAVASVIAVSASGIPGMRLACQQSLFQPFVRYPDCLLIRAPPPGSGQATIERAGYFGRDWSMSTGEWVSRQSSGI